MTDDTYDDAKAERWPAPPTEREEREVMERIKVVSAALSDLHADRMLNGEMSVESEAAFILARLRTHSPENQPCRIYEHDGAYQCSTHDRLWGAVTNPDEPCRSPEEPVGYVVDHVSESGRVKHVGRFKVIPGFVERNPSRYRAYPIGQPLDSEEGER